MFPKFTNMFRLIIRSGRCTLSAVYKPPINLPFEGELHSKGTFIFEGREFVEDTVLHATKHILDARLQQGSWYRWHPLVTIRDYTATLSDETNAQTTRLPCKLAFQKDPKTNRERVVLSLKADVGLCNAKLIFVSLHSFGTDFSIAKL